MGGCGRWAWCDTAIHFIVARKQKVTRSTSPVLTSSHILTVPSALDSLRDYSTNEIRAFVIQSTPPGDWLNQLRIQTSTDGHCGLASFLVARIKHHDQNWCMGEDTYFGLQIQRGKYTLWWESMAASGRHSSPSRKLGDHITSSSRKPRKQARHKAGLSTPKAHPETHVFQQGCIV